MRKTIITVGDLQSDAIAATKGTPQGSVLSPLLFNLFIASLHHALQKVDGWDGIRVSDGSSTGRSITVRDLFYADDLALLASSQAQAQAAITAVVNWAADWGLELGIGKDKTAAMIFRLDATKAVIPETRLTAGTVEIPWVPRYRYLGYVLRFNLENDSVEASAECDAVEGMADKQRNKLEGLRNQFFTWCSIMSALPVTVQFQFLTTLLMGAVSYLFSVIPMTAKELTRLDSQIHLAAKDVLGLPRSAPTALVQAESRTLTFAAVYCMHRHRLLHHLRLTPYQDSIAARVFQVTRGETWRGAGRPKRLQPWVQHTQDLLAKHRRRAQALHLPFDDDPRAFWDIHRSAGVTARNTAYVIWAKTLMPTNGVPSMKPAARPPKAVVASLYLPSVGSAALLGNRKDCTSLAVTGPGCSGALLALCSMGSEYTTVPLQARLGVQAMAMKPFVTVGLYAQGPTTDPSSLERKDKDAKTAADAVREASAGCSHCRAEGGPAPPEDVWHLVFECSRPKLCSIRTALSSPSQLFCKGFARSCAGR
jgi:hypothetical protein